MIYSKGEEKKEITLEIKTLIIDESRPDDIGRELQRLLEVLEAFDDMPDDDSISQFLADDEAADEIELCTEATIETNEQGNVEITYNEDQGGNGEAVAKIIFDPKEPELVVMSKRGAVNTVLSFEQNKTHVCQYVTPYMTFKVYVVCNSVRNTLLRDGKLKLDYLLNINDSFPQHFYISVKIKEAPEDILKDLFC